MLINKMALKEGALIVRGVLNGIITIFVKFVSGFSFL